MAIFKRLWNIYLGSTMAYGFARAVTYDRESTGLYHNKKTDRGEVKEMLVIDQVWRVMGMTCSTAVLWPFLLGNDLSRLECVMRGKNYEEYRWWP